MLDADRIRLMTRMASYEAGEGKKNAAIGGYFRGDYLSMQVIKSIIHGTIAFLIILAIYIFYDFNTFMADIYKIDIMSFVKQIIIIYLVSVAVYALISYAVYSYRYKRARKSLKVYYNNLKKLSIYYNQNSEK